MRLNAVLGLYPANAVGDDIEVYDEDTPECRAGPAKAKLFGLRQQVGALTFCAMHGAACMRLVHGCGWGTGKGRLLHGQAVHLRSSSDAKEGVLEAST